MRTPALLIAAIAALPLACSDDDDPLGPAGGNAPTLTVDARNGWVFVKLGESASVVEVADPTTSMAWDIAFFASAVMLNGGAAGPGGVTGHCLCDRFDAPDSEILALSAEATEAEFLAVGPDRVPSDPQAWLSDALDPAIDGWYSYNPVTHQVAADPTRVWKVRTRTGAYAKLHVTAVEGSTQAHAGQVTVEYATQPAAGEPFGPVRTHTLDASQGWAYLDLSNETAGDASAWDIALSGWDIRVNGGVSGDGNVAAVLGDESFEEMQDAGDAPAGVYRGDNFGGVFDAYPWYRYNLLGNDHQIWPTHDVYLIRRGDDTWKIQIISYYDEDARSRFVTFRYAAIED